MTSAAVRLSRDGRLEVVRRAPPEDPVRLAATIERLQRAAGTGVVELVGVETGDDGEVVLVLVHAGAPISGPLPAADIAHVGASAAATLADVHARGMVHGAVRGEHVLRDATGTVRLCGFGGGEGSPADDVADLAVLLRELLGPRDTTDAARDLRVLVDRCTVDDPLARPTAGAVAAALASAAPAPRTIERPTPPRPRTRARTFASRGASNDGESRRTYREVAVMAAAVVVAVAVGLVLARWPRPAPADAAPSAAPVETSTTARRASTTSTTATAVAARRVWPSAPPNVLHANGTWTFGTADDHVVVGDWDCDGVDTPALLQPDGDVYVVDEWTDDTVARLVTTIDGAVAARVERGDPCDRLVIDTDDGRTVTPSMDGS